MLRTLLYCLTVLTLCTVTLHAAETQTKPLIDLSAANVDQQFKSGSPQVSLAPGNPGLVVKIQPGNADYPGFDLKPATPWDLSAFGHVDVRVENIGAKTLNLSARLDNAGPWQDNPWNTESATIKPGGSGTVKVIFGYAYGHKPSYKLNAAAITNLKLFSGKVDTEASFRIVSIEAAGPAGEQPAVDPASIRIKPTDGLMLGDGVAFDVAQQVATKGAQAKATEGGVRIDYPAKEKEHAATIKPPQGKWDLRLATEVAVKVKNSGKSPATARVRVDSTAGPTDAVDSGPIAPGVAKEVVVSFIPTVPWKGIPNSGDRTSWNGQPNTGSKFVSDAVSGVIISVEHSSEDQTLVVESIRARVTPADVPTWVGQRPPVEGDWDKTFDDEFEGTAIDTTKWNITGPNFWDKKSHWSKDNLLIGNGVVKMHYEKKTGPHNDEPAGKVSDYASGYLDTYGKWTQKYGYFETRVKLPTAPGLWPAFWLMPDRGVEAGEQWKRQDTAKGAMEFDVLEQLTRWGPYRFNIAMHWDGYQKSHKQTGSDKIYFQPDKDGFVTVGLLWTPAQAVYYVNGGEVLRWEDPRISQVQSNMMFTLPMGGWDNSPLDDTKLPDDFVIDYVRCWQRKDLKSAGADKADAK